MKFKGRRHWRRHIKGMNFERPVKVPGVRLMRMLMRNGKDPDPTKPRPFSAASLVGMSQGARKRAAGKKERRAAHLARKIGLVPFADKYRIGERLRPCFGCCTCKSRRLRKREGWACGPFMVTPNTLFMFGLGPVPVPNPIEHEWLHCDGSGVLPAKGGGR